ncbi:hypothetical protein AMATHDRAFT_76049 [Amanita thiersii Skay4041]|uniref:DUF4246 domain-containing protein n=1 Tax=Amanita thiersii Skay4041 TaxID=703135 RepID=A0A2A9NPI9_9AGAR|nr:hypothetical protein AMATHDRAFT_76049 [Amanita thiersii Skay4041]
MHPNNFYSTSAYRHPFVNAIDYLTGVGGLTEQAMTQLSAYIRRQHQWWDHIHDSIQRDTWTNAANKPWIVKASAREYSIHLSHKQIEYVLNELSGYAALRDQVNKCQVSCFERIWESTSLLDDLTTVHFLEEVDILFESKKNSATNTGGRCEIFLVDPYLYPFIYDRTFTFIGGDELGIRTLSGPVFFATSTKFSLLPTDVHISENYEGATFLSYINDLHPARHKVMYSLLSKLLCKLVPLFERTLTDLHRNNPLKLRIPGSYCYTEWDEPDPPEHSDDEEGWVNHQEEIKKWELSRPIKLPDVPETGYPGGVEDRNHRVYLRGRTIQIVTEILDIRLEPGSQAIPESDWRVQGTRNECIAAIGVHCLFLDNIEPYSIMFRMPVAFPESSCPGDASGIERTWGLRSGDPTHQYLGFVPMQSGMTVVFPNIYQHCRSQITLADPTSQGRVVLIFFSLVDPEVRGLLSTSIVPPQQKDWIQDAVTRSLFPRLPAELIDKIMRETEGLMDFPTAMGYRSRMIAERALIRRYITSHHFCVPFRIYVQA